MLPIFTWISSISLYFNNQGAPVDCLEPICCRFDSPVEGESRKAGYWGSRGACDLPERSLDLLVREIARKQPKFIVYTGDNPAHDIWSPDLEDEAVKVLELTVQKLKEEGFKGKFIAALGNHESKPVNILDFNHREETRRFFSRFSEALRDHLDEEAIETFNKGGYYSIKHEGIRFIVNNCFLCTTGNFHIIENPTDPLDQFKWMERELSKAEIRKEPVYMLGHISFGRVEMTEECNLRYKALVDRYSDIIKAQFYGHTHGDNLKLNTGYFDKNKTTGVMLVTSSGTTFGGRNPSFKQFEALNRTKELLDWTLFKSDVADVKKEDIPQFKPYLNLRKVCL